MEYPDVIDAATLGRAVALTRALRGKGSGSVAELAAIAVVQTYPTGVTEAEDAEEQQYSSLHQALVDQVASAVRVAEAKTGRLPPVGKPKHEDPPRRPGPTRN